MIGAALGAGAVTSKAKAAGGAASTVDWGTVTTIADGSVAGVTAAFPSTFKAKNTYGNSSPIVFYKTKMVEAVTIHDADTTTTKAIVFSLQVKGAALSGSATVLYAEVHADGKKICDADLVGASSLTDTIVADYIGNVLCAPTTSNNNPITITNTNFFGIYVSGTADKFYAQCGMTFNAAISFDDNVLTSSAYLTTSNAFEGTATAYTCGCTVKSGSLSHTGGKLTLDVVLTSPVEVPYTVFQLARDDSEKLLFDTSVTATADDYLTTWKAGKVAATFTTVSAAADPLTTSDSVTATLTTADKAADLNATLVSLDTDGTTAAKADVATDGTTEKPVKFEFTFVKDLCLGNKKVYVNCFLYGAAAANAAVDETVAANYKGKGTAQSFDCESGSDDSGAENSIGFSMFLLMLTALAIEL